MINLRENYWAVEVPDKIGNPHFYRVNNSSIMLKWDDIERPLNIHDLVKVDTYYGNLDDYKWPQIICTSKEATDEQLKIMDDVLQHNNFKEWFQNFYGRLSYFLNRKASFISLLTSKGCDANKTYLILKKTA